MNNLTVRLLVILFLCFGTHTAFAQNFVPPQAQSFPYSQYGNKAPSGTENYGGFLINSGFGVAPIYMSSIYSDDPIANPGEFIVMITANFDPTNILYQESFLYPDCTDIQMGVSEDYHTKINYVLVAYHKAGVGHLLDIYEVTNSTSTPLVLNSTETLSTIPHHTRINMDSDLWSRRTLIGWEHPDEGIQTMVMYANQPNGITTLAGTQGASNPDVAINNVTGPTTPLIDWAHIVYQDKAQNTISVAAIQLGLLATPIGTNATVNAQVVDVRAVPDNVSPPNIDCPNSLTYGWAYTYTDGKEVIVRLREWNTYNTIVVNDGSLGNTPASQNFTAYHPTLFYGNPLSGTGGITVAWYSVYPGTDAHYIAVEVTPSGNLLSASDYLRLPNGIVWYTPHSGIDLGRLSDGDGVPYDYLYATYIVRDQNLGFTLQHAFHKWNNSVFSGNAKLELEKTPANTFPNPFDTYISKNINVAEDGILKANLTDVTGRIVAQYNEKVSAGDQTFQIKNLGELLPGTYYLSTYINNNRLQTEVIVKR